MKVKVLGFYKGSFVSGTYWFTGDKEDMEALRDLRSHFVGLMMKVK